MIDESIKLKLNTDLANGKKGQVITVKACKGVPLDRYWRNRLDDSIFDNCVEVVEEKEVLEQAEISKEFKKRK